LAFSADQTGVPHIIARTTMSRIRVIIGHYPIHYPAML
jgi:hypothetical protein